VVLANLTWVDELDIEGFVLVTLAVAVGVAVVWIFVGVMWLLIAASLYLALLVTVRYLTHRRRD
jgi:hypothetical protein